MFFYKFSSVSENDEGFEVTMTATADADLSEEGVAQIQVPWLLINFLIKCTFLYKCVFMCLCVCVDSAGGRGLSLAQSEDRGLACQSGLVHYQRRQRHTDEQRCTQGQEPFTCILREKLKILHRLHVFRSKTSNLIRIQRYNLYIIS